MSAVAAYRGRFIKYAIHFGQDRALRGTTSPATRAQHAGRVGAELFADAGDPLVVVVPVEIN